MNVIYTKDVPQVVAHKVELIGYKGHFSAWYALDGTVEDCERFDRLGRAYPCNRHMRARLAKAWSLVSYYAGLEGAPANPPQGKS